MMVSFVENLSALKNSLLNVSINDAALLSYSNRETEYL